jgi:prevent-host-death family protein
LIAYCIAMKVANIAQLKNRLSEYLAAVRLGEIVEVRKRNVPIAQLIPVRPDRANRTVLGRGRGTGRILGDVTGPIIASTDWDMLGGEPQ